MKIRNLFLVSAFGLSVAAPAAAITGTLKPTGFAKGYELFGLSTGQTVETGGFVGTWDTGGGPNPIQFWCAELSQTFSFGHSYIYNETLPSNATYTMLGQLFHEAYGVALSDTEHSAAFQLAIWEILFDPDLDLKSGAFRVTNDHGHGATVSLAQGWLDNLGKYTDNYDIFHLANESHQDFITGTPPRHETPEPAPLALVGIGIVAMIIAARRGKPAEA